MDAVSIHTIDLALVSWSQEDLVVCSVSMPNHLTFLLIVTLQSEVHDSLLDWGTGPTPSPFSNISVSIMSEARQF